MEETRPKCMSLQRDYQHFTHYLERLIVPFSGQIKVAV